jgi:hypothetical protein
MYSSEVFPLNHRETGMALACSMNFGLAGLLAFLVSYFPTPYVGGPSSPPESNPKIDQMLEAFIGLDLLAAILVWLFMRSPRKPTSLEDMDVCCSASIRVCFFLSFFLSFFLLRICFEVLISV